MKKFTIYLAGDGLPHMKKQDIFLIFIILVIAACAYCAHYYIAPPEGNYVEVKVDGVIEGTYSLSEDQEIVINGGTNVLKIEDGKAKMIEADCPDQLCVHQKEISAAHESIICLPNKVVVQTVTGNESGIDAMTN
ncbi:MAG: NusG domain II-containing protein [Lachnospiraceae bacterium]|jgi:hypothetical protein|nr:NusG domain II-containing protein [Lachnospiraceae bacterium]